jgi:hypothetical protein
MVLRLFERLAIPLRERNTLLVAAGYAPMYRERPLDDPALALDRHWNLLAANAALPHLLAGADPVLAELQAYPLPEGADDTHLAGEHLGMVMPFQFRTDHGVLSFISTTTIFGTPVDVTLQELMLETFFPADAFTTGVLHQLLSPA